MRHHGVVLCEDGKDDGRGARGEVVEEACRERPEKQGQDRGRHDACEEVRNDEEGLHCLSVYGRECGTAHQAARSIQRIFSIPIGAQPRACCRG